MNYLFGKTTNISEKILTQNKIPLINKTDLKIDKTSCLAITGSGKFYKATYQNQAVTVKVNQKRFLYRLFLLSKKTRF